VSCSIAPYTHVICWPFFLNVKESEARALLYTLHKYEKIVGKAITNKNQKFISEHSDEGTVA